MRVYAMLLSLLICVGAFSAFASEDLLCVQSFNIYGPAYASHVLDRVGQTADTLVKDPCDVVQIQELWKENQEQIFENRLLPAQMDYVRADSLRHDHAIIGLTSAIHGMVLEAYSELYQVNNQDGVLDWIRDLSGVQKGFTAIETRIDGMDQNLLLINTHTHPMNAAIRVAQMIQLVDYVYHRSEAPIGEAIVFSGDLNATPDSLEVAILEKLLFLKDAFLQVNGQYGSVCTYCKANPLSWSNTDRVIDYNMYRSGDHLDLIPISSAVNLKGADSRHPLSDHYGVRTQFEWQDRATKLLPMDDPEVLARRDQAVGILQKAIDVMRSEHKAFMKNAIRAALDLQNEFIRDGELSPHAEFALRQP